MIGDVINSLFEALGGLMVLNHCRIVWRDKAVAGVSIISTAFSPVGAFRIFIFTRASVSGGVSLAV